MAGPLGCFVVWRRMSYIGDTLAHSALLGVSLGIFFNLDLNIATATVAMGIAFLLGILGSRAHLSLDALLGILSHSTLALGLVIISFVEGIRVDIMSLLFGDILSVDAKDLLIIYSNAGIILILLGFFWRSLLSITVSSEMAHVDGINVMAIRTTLMLMIASVIALAMKLVGILLITALLIIPAAAARNISRSPEKMAIYSTTLGILSVLLGIAMSWAIDTPAGPSIILCSAVIFLILNCLYKNPVMRIPS